MRCPRRRTRRPRGRTRGGGLSSGQPRRASVASGSSSRAVCQDTWLARACQMDARVGSVSNGAVLPTHGSPRSTRVRLSPARTASMNRSSTPHSLRRPFSAAARPRMGGCVATNNAEVVNRQLHVSVGCRGVLDDVCELRLEALDLASARLELDVVRAVAVRLSWTTVRIRCSNQSVSRVGGIRRPGRRCARMSDRRSFVT
jgi:hypothetical protein